MEGREQFTFYRSIYEAIKLIKGKGAVAAREQAFDAVCAFAFLGVEPNLDEMDSRAAIAFISAKPNLLASRRKADSGKKGGSVKQAESKPEANGKQTASEKEGEIEIEKENECYNTPTPQIPYEQIRGLYNSILLSLPSCTKMSEARRKAIKARFASGYTLEDFDTLFRKTAVSSFLTGNNSRNWMANFDWLIQDGNMAKVLSGNYDDRSAAKKEMHERELDREEQAAIRRMLEG